MLCFHGLKSNVQGISTWVVDLQRKNPRGKPLPKTLPLSLSPYIYIYIYIYIPEKQIKRKEQIQCQPLHPQLPQEVGRFYHALDTSQEFDDLPDDQGNADYEDDTCQTSGA